MATLFRSTTEPRTLHGTGTHPLFTHHARVIIAALGVALLLAVALRSGGPAERRTLLEMRPEARRELYEETRRSTEMLCSPSTGGPGLLDRCVDSAAFLLSFPECDEQCRAFARAHQRAPTR